MDEDKWISVDKRTNKLVLRFHVKGYAKQFFIATGLGDTQGNRELVRVKRGVIFSDIALERFDATLQTYQFKANRYSPPIAKNSAYAYDLAVLWDKFAEFKKSLVERTTILGKYRCTARYIAKLPTKELDQAPKIRDWLLANTTHFMAWSLLANFSECCTWSVNSGLISHNPFEKLKIKRPKRKSTEDEDYRAFTLEQRNLIIYGFEGHRIYNYYAPLIKFLFFTGCRLGEAFALTWGDISPDCTRITINKSCNLYKVKKGTKNGKRRTFPTTPGSKLQLLLFEMKSAAGEISASKLVFPSKGGERMDSCKLLRVWNKKTTYRNGKREFLGVVGELASQGKLHYLKPYATRHTFATHAIASGVTPDKVALWIGDEVQTVLKFYCHPNVIDSECPDF